MKYASPINSISHRFLTLRKLAGPFHRRRHALDHDQNDDLPPLPAPWTDPRWFRGGFPPRRHCTVRPMVHGQEYFTDLQHELLAARERVTIVGWSLTPYIPLLRDEDESATALVHLLHQVSQQAEVYVLLWAGAPLLFEPSQHLHEEVRRTLLDAAPRVQMVLDDSARFSHDHHQKAITVDGRVAYVGGMDLSTFQGDRWDTREHPLRFGPNWHDVQARLEGEIVRDVEENFCQRWNAVTGDRLAPIDVPDHSDSQNTPAQIVRTIPAQTYPFAPEGEFGIHHALIAAIRGATRYVYLENQYLWAPEIVEALTDAMNRKRDDPFRVVVVLPADAYMGKYDNDEHVRDLTAIDRGRGIFSAYSLYASGPAEGRAAYRYLPIYVHAKVSIVDDEWFSIGSGNLNRRGIATDTEMNVQCIAPEIARSLRLTLWSEHLGLSDEEVATVDPIHLIDHAWPDAARRVEEHLEKGDAAVPAQARTYHPGLNPGSRFLDVLQAMTLER